MVMQMPVYSRTELGLAASNYGFKRDVFEKVFRLKKLLVDFGNETLLADHLVLKGGTAINLTILPLPRLSVDIDMDYVPNDSREEMLSTRKRIIDMIRRYMVSEGYHLSDNSRSSHSLDSFHFQYQNSAGNNDVLKVELNYSLRAHVFEPVWGELQTDAFGDRIVFRTVHPIEIAAAKTIALLSRAAARDLYDSKHLIESGLFETGKSRDLLRKTIIFYKSITSESVNRVFDTSEIDNITFSKISRDLFPVLRAEEVHEHFDINAYKTAVKDYLWKLMILTPKETEYMDRFTAGEYRPDLLFEDNEILRRIKNHPMALWKCRER